MTLSSLRSRLATIQLNMEMLKAEGDYLQGVRLEKSASGGTASQSAKKKQDYARLRSGQGKMLANGKKSQYVPKGAIAEVEAAIARGKRLTKLEKQMRAIEVQLQTATERLEKWKKAGFAFGQVIRFVDTMGDVEMEIDGVVLAREGEKLKIAYRAFVAGEGTQTGIMRVAIADIQLT